LRKEQIALVRQHKDSLPVNRACKALGLPRASFYRSGHQDYIPPTKRHSPRRLAEVLSVLSSERFCDVAPAEVFATLLDEGIYLCSERTMYRVLHRNSGSTQRRQKAPRAYKRPELLATRPNQVWTWDITKLKGPAKWTYFYLYTILDIFSRYIVGWLVADREASELANDLIAETCLKQEILPGSLTLHSDRGATMKSRAVGQLLADPGVTKSFSRPHVSDDNPFVESSYKTLKYRPEFPERFLNEAHTIGFCRTYFDWHNNHHRHAGIGMLTPADVHYHRAEEIIRRRQIVLEQAYRNHPERFVKGVPLVAQVPKAVWINKPRTPAEKDQTASLTKNDIVSHFY
jgi:putative transposase